MHNINVIIAIFLSLSIPAFAQAQISKLSPEEQISDIENYYQVLRERHIGLYRYTSKKDFNSFIESITNNISDSCSQYDFYKTICLINSKICCGHSNVIFPDSTLIDKESFIPFSLFQSGTEYYVNSNKTYPQLPIDHKQVISINNMPIDTIIDEIYRYHYDDGQITTRKRIFTMNIFPIYYAWYIDKQPMHQIVFCDSLNTMDTLSLESINYKTLARKLNENNEPKEDKLIKYHQDTVNNFIFLGIESFYTDPEVFCPYLDSIFKEIRITSCNNLIIDVRGNTGGKIKNEYHLMSYLITERLKSPFKRYFLDGKLIQRKYRREYIEPQNYQFTGDIYFLMDGYTFSAASEFLSIAKYLQLGTFIGEETGGAVNGCNYGKYKYKLPNSKIICQIPYAKSIFTKHLDKKGRGVMPDYPIIFTKDDYTNNRDKCMEKTIELIQKKMNI